MFNNFRVDLIVVGNLKEKALKQLSEEYEKRIKGYIKLNIIEVKDSSNKLNEIDVLKEERDRILKVLDPNSYLMILDLNKKMYDSVEFADMLEKTVVYNNSKMTFIIGGSLGIHEDIKKMSEKSITFSKMTFPHQLFRIMFLEQLYRSLRIKNNEPYHK